ncbi:hypothetical protein IKF92_01540 [Candidatus Saccharibacteria bacterium]|nr:hypothetical protein [Candidatus Saccharibacteria bacterium]
MKKINLNTGEYNDKFAMADIYAKKGIIKAIQITEDGLKAGEYADKDIRFDNEKAQYVIDTYVMREVSAEGEGGFIRKAELEDTRPVEVGEWIATNPKAYDTDRDNNYAIPDATFQKRYELTDKPGVYRAKGMARIIQNDTGDAVEIEAPWGGTQNGDEKCYFCAPYNKDDPDDLAVGDRYILSENDFVAYGLASEVLGEEWNK